MSSFAASCSTCCHPASCASATSDSLPTATALLCCRCAFDSSATQRRWLLRQHHHPPIRLTHSGTAQSAVEPVRFLRVVLQIIWRKYLHFIWRRLGTCK